MIGQRQENTAKLVTTRFISFLAVTFALWLFLAPLLDDGRQITMTAGLVIGLAVWLSAEGDRMSNRHTPLFSLLSILAVWALSSTLYLVTPLFCDDILYQPYTPQRYGDFISFMFTYDSPRMLNLLFPIFLHTLPKTAVNLLSGTLWALSIILMCRCSGTWLNRYARMAALIFALEFFLPWDNGMTCIIFTLNYIYSLPLAIGMIICFCDEKPVGSFPRLLLLALLGFCAGWVQESESLPIICGISVWCAINRTAISRRRLWIAIPMVVSCLTLIIVSSFGRYTHSNVSFDSFNQPLSMLIYVTLTRTYGMIAVTLLMLALLARRKFRMRLWRARRGPLPILLTAMYVSTAIGITLWNMGTHLSWFPQLFAILSAMTIINIVWQKPLIKNRVGGRAVGAIIMAIVITNLVTAILFTRDEARNLHLIENTYLRADSPDKFYELTPQTRLPLAAWNKLGVANIYNTSWMWRVHSSHYSRRVKEHPIPSELSRITPSILRKVPGDSPLYRFGDLLVMPDDGTREPINLTVTYRYGVRKTSQFNLSPFIADNGGRWIYAVNETTDPQSRWIAITKINR